MGQSSDKDGGLESSRTGQNRRFLVENLQGASKDTEGDVLANPGWRGRDPGLGVIMGRTIMIPKDGCMGEAHQFR